jgi:hypothetical protein
VQEFGLQILMLADKRDAAERYFDEWRSRMLAQDPSRLPTLFPEWAQSTKAVQPGELDDAQVEWIVPATADERAELDRWIAAHSSGLVAAAELGTGGWT